MPRAAGQSDAHDAASFGGGVRWRLGRIGSVQWSVALSLPLGLIALALLAAGPWFIGGTGLGGLLGFNFFAEQASGTRTLHLALAWVLALLIQVTLTQLLFTISRRGRWIGRRSADAQPDGGEQSSNAVTLTIAGVWMAIPKLVAPRHASAESFADRDDSARSDAVNGELASMLESFGGASRVLFLWAWVLLALGTAALACLLAEVLLAEVLLSGSAAAEPRRPADAGVPAIALLDRPWVASGWIFCVQGFWQLLPLPQALGRVGWSAAIGLLCRGASDELIDPQEQAGRATRVVQWWVVGFAVAVLVAGVGGISLSGIDARAGGQALPVFAGLTLLALWLGMSARGADLSASQLSLAANGETGILRSRSGLGLKTLWQRWQSARQERQRTKRLLETLDRERSEASDASRVDEILQRLHARGPAALSNEERELLSRVSEAIRRQRERDNSLR